MDGILSHCKAVLDIVIVSLAVYHANVLWLLAVFVLIEEFVDEWDSNP